MTLSIIQAIAVRPLKQTSYLCLPNLNLGIEGFNSETCVRSEEYPDVVVVGGAAEGGNHLPVLLHDLNHLPGRT